MTTNSPGRYTKKPITIEAWQWDGTPQSATLIIDWLLTHDHTARWNPHTGLFIDTLEGTMRADPGDWVARGIHGEFYPIKNAIFRETYGPAEGAS